ncbi:MAG: carboxypeptidase M32 [Nitrospira sp.]|nr:carboxypeptidase M32 [Nitrospira sp.]
MPDSTHNLTALKSRLLEIRHLKDAAALLSWDQETYMPAGGGQTRAEQIATLQTLAHAKFVSPETEDLLLHHIDPATGLANADADGLDDASKALLRETWRDFSRAKKLPSDFVNRLERECSLAQQVWAEARRRNDFMHFLPNLQNVIALKVEEVGHVGYDGSPYDALLDTYEPGATLAQLQPLFASLRHGLLELLRHVREAAQPDDRILFQAYEEQQQIAFGKLVLHGMGYDFNRGRLDLSAHPFTTAFHPTDVRVTTRVFEKDLPSCLFSCIHEGGHGLYDQGLPQEHYGTPLGESLSLGIHESQSRLWENNVGRSKAFWTHFLPLLRQYFPAQLGTVSLDAFHAALNKVNPSLIRVEADEVTYNLHIMVRFDIELALIEQRVPVKDLPGLWREKMQEYLGIVPERDADGVLQDVHWSLGALGYFPTYTLGNLYASMFFQQALQDIPGLEIEIQRGHLLSLKAWLNHNIHQCGRQYSATDLLHRITGQTLSVEPFLLYLRTKIGDIYGFTSTQ